MEQPKKVGASKPEVAGKTPGKKKTPINLTQHIHQTNGLYPDGLDKYFQVLPLVENFLNKTEPKLKKESVIFFTPYPVVSFIVRSLHAILKEKLGKSLGLAGETVRILDPAAGMRVFLIPLPGWQLTKWSGNMERKKYPIPPGKKCREHFRHCEKFGGESWGNLGLDEKRFLWYILR